MQCPECLKPGVAKATPCDIRVTSSFVTILRAHRAPSGHRHEEAYRVGEPCSGCGLDLWAPLFWPGYGAEQRAWRCVPCSRAKSLADYYKRTGTPTQKAERASRVKHKRAQEALRVLRAVVPELPNVMTARVREELEAVARLMPENDAIAAGKRAAAAAVLR